MEQMQISIYRTKQDLVYLTLKDFIVSCILPPGERLVIRDLADRLGVSETPVRSALTRLASEGLVDHVSHVGAVVGRVSDEDILDIHLLVGAVQGLAAARVASKPRQEDVLRISDLLDRIEALPDDATFWDYATRNQSFHRGIVEASGSAIYLSLFDHLFEKVNRARTVWAAPTHRTKARVEHREIMVALERGHAEEAQAAEEKHWQRAGREFLEQVRNRQLLLADRVTSGSGRTRTQRTATETAPARGRDETE